MTANSTYVEYVNMLKTELGLSDADFEKIKEIAYNEAEALFNLKNESKKLTDSVDSVEEEYKYAELYNEQFKKIQANTLTEIKQLLGKDKYFEFHEYLVKWWYEQLDPQSEFNIKLNKELQSHIELTDANTSAEWISVFATQYNGHTNDEVALPDKYIKWANLNYYDGGWPNPPSAYNNPPYLLPIKYGTRQVTKRILEVGPWNENDNYWRPNSGTNFRRIYNALREFNDRYGGEVCTQPITLLDRYYPQATAANENRHFCGYDERGRFTNGAGIDITPEVASQLGIGRLQNVWLSIDVSNLP